MHEAVRPRPAAPAPHGPSGRAAATPGAAAPGRCHGRAGAALALGAVLLLAGCGSSAVDDASSGASTGAAATGAAATTTAAPATTATATGSATTAPAGTRYTVSTDTSFQTPTGNIGCVVGPDWVRCDISEHSFDAGQQPSSCDVDWGDSVTLEGSGAATLTCHGDTVLGQGQVLQYGESMTSGTYTCTSQESGVVCEDEAQEHGFSLSKAAYELH